MTGDWQDKLSRQKLIVRGINVTWVYSAYGTYTGTWFVQVRGVFSLNLIESL